MIFKQLGVLTDEVSQNFEEALDWIAEQNLTHVEIRMVDGTNVVDLSDDQLDAILTKVKNRGLFISGIASPIFKCALDLSRPVESGDRFGQVEESVDEHFQKLKRVIQIAHKLQTNKIRIFSFWREQNPSLFEQKIVDYLKAATRIAESLNIILLLENEGSCNGGCALEVANILRRVNSPCLKALWDPGNEAYVGKSAFPEGYNVIRNFIGHIHLKDAWIDHNGVPYCVPIGSGNVSYADHFKALQKDGYNGLFTIETHYIPEGGSPIDGTKKTIEGLKKIILALN